MPTRKDGSLSNHVHIASSSWLPAELIQFNDLGRHRVTSRIWGFGKEMVVKEVEGGGEENAVDAMMFLCLGLQWLV